MQIYVSRKNYNFLQRIQSTKNKAQFNGNNVMQYKTVFYVQTNISIKFKDCSIIYILYKLIIDHWMITTVPKKRNHDNFKNKSAQLKALQDKYASNNNKFTFMQYCQYSLIYLDAPDQKFYQENGKVDLMKLTNPNINYDNPRQKHNKHYEEIIQTGKKIIKILTYAWENIQKHIEDKLKKKGKPQDDDKMQIYSEQNINLHFARLEQSLKDLQSKKFRWQIYVKSNSFSREMEEKEIKQQITFIKLLQTIIDTQTKKVEYNRKKPRSPQKQHKKQGNEAQQQQKLDIGKIVKADEYFKKKYYSSQIQQTLGPFKQIEERRRLNISALRYHYASFKNEQ